MQATLPPKRATISPGDDRDIHYRLHRDPQSSHQQIARLVRRLGRSPVLDVGAAQGHLGRLCAGSGLEIDGIELNPEWAEMAQPFYRAMLVGSIEEVAPPSRDYRAVVCADVLEHLVDPLLVLRRLRSLATDDAYFVVSLPNVAHVAVRLMLLFGRFPKMERGILDRTHLHFYTRDTAEDLLRDAGLRVVAASATGVPLEELWRGGEQRLLYRLLLRLQHLIVRAAPRLFGFQWIFVCTAINSSHRNQ